MSRVEINSKAPVIEAEDYIGNKISLEDFKNRYNVLLVFNRGFV